MFKEGLHRVRSSDVSNLCYRIISTIFVSFDTVYTATAYSQKLEIELQKAEVDSNAYRILWMNEKEQSYIYYDQLRQIQANQEAQEAFDNDQNN